MDTFLHIKKQMNNVPYSGKFLAESVLDAMLRLAMEDF